MPTEVEPTLFLYLKVYTLTSDGNTKKRLGTTFIPLLLTDSDPRQKTYLFVNEGGHQLPLFYKSFVEKKEEEETTRVPCASLLVRLARIPSNKLKGKNVFF